MSVRDWLEQRLPKAPETLHARVIEALGAAVAEPEEELPEVCVAAADRLLAELLDEQRFAREGALDLLAADALMTYAYEYAARTRSPGEVQALALEGARVIGRLTVRNV